MIVNETPEMTFCCTCCQQKHLLQPQYCCFTRLH